MVSSVEVPTSIEIEVPPEYDGNVVPAAAVRSLCDNASNGPQNGLGNNNASAAIVSVRWSDWPACVVVVVADVSDTTVRTLTCWFCAIASIFSSIGFHSLV